MFGIAISYIVLILYEYVMWKMIRIFFTIATLKIHSRNLELYLYFKFVWRENNSNIYFIIWCLMHVKCPYMSEAVLTINWPNVAAHLKVRFTKKMLVKWSKCHSSKPYFAPEDGGKFKMMNCTDEMLILSFFFISKINL